MFIILKEENNLGSLVVAPLYFHLRQSVDGADYNVIFLTSQHFSLSSQLNPYCIAAFLFNQTTHDNKKQINKTL